MDLAAYKRKGIPITMLTAHDYPSARFIESSSSPTSTPSSENTTKRGIDICLVGDSLAMVACGYSNTNMLGLEELLYHCRSVARGCQTSFLVSDMPFGTFAVSTPTGVAAAVRIIQEGHMDAVKIEGGEEVVGLVKRLSEIGIPVMGHVGLKPQRQAAYSGFRVQGRTLSSALTVYQEAHAIQRAGAFSIVLEAVPTKLAAFISASLSIPTIGIGAGSACDGQVLVQLDMLGVNSLSSGGPKFLKRFAETEREAVEAIGRYVEEVRTKSFPEDEVHGYSMEEDVWEQFLLEVKK